jgi:predicted amidohydrolase
MKLALAQFEVQRGNPFANLEMIRALIAQAKKQGAQAIFLPEMCTTGFDWQCNLELLADAAALR